MEKVRVFKNESKVTQVYYDRFNNPVELKPGETFTEDLSNVINVGDLVKREMDRRALADDVDESRRVRRKMALIRSTKRIEELDKFKDGEKNQDLLDAILLKEKELLDGDRTREDRRAESLVAEGIGESVDLDVER
jgi:hypothetical protein